MTVFQIYSVYEKGSGAKLNMAEYRENISHLQNGVDASSAVSSFHDVVEDTKAALFPLIKN